MSAFGFSKLDEQAGFCFRFCDGCLALGLQCPKLGHVLFDGAADPLFVGDEELEILGLADPGAALGESGVDFGMGGVGVGVLLKAEGEDGVFECASSAMAWASSSSRAPTGARASRMASQCFWKAAWSSGVWMTIWPVRPWRKTFKEERFLPSRVLGPVENWAFSRHAAS